MNIVYLEELKEKGYTQSVRDYSPRGYHTVPVDEVKPGDEVLINNHWHTVIKGKAHVVYKSTLKRIGKSYRVKDDSSNSYHDVPVNQIRPGDVVLVGYRHFKVRDILYKVTCATYEIEASNDEEHCLGTNIAHYVMEEEAIRAIEFYKKGADETQKLWNAHGHKKFEVIDMDIVELDEDLDWWEIDDSLWINREHYVTSLI